MARSTALLIVLAFAGAMAGHADPCELTTTVRFADRHTLVWDLAPAAHRYNVYKGIRDVSDPFEYVHDCLALDLVATPLVDSLPIARDRLVYYLVTVEDAHGDEGPLGDGPGGSPRPPAAPCTDVDGDAVSDGIDNCPSWPNPAQEDFDLDASGDACDDDDDDDGLADLDELALGTDPFDGDTDDDGLPDGEEVSVWLTDPRSTDTDADGLPDGTDNCRRTSNPSQEDEDADAVGDVCDSCPGDFNPGQENIDEDGVGDACERRLTRSVLDSAGGRVLGTSCRIGRVSIGQSAAGAAWSSAGATLCCGFAPESP